MNSQNNSNQAAQTECRFKPGGSFRLAFFCPFKIRAGSRRSRAGSALRFSKKALPGLFPFSANPTSMPPETRIRKLAFPFHLPNSTFQTPLSKLYFSNSTFQTPLSSTLPFFSSFPQSRSNEKLPDVDSGSLALCCFFKTGRSSEPFFIRSEWPPAG